MEESISQQQALPEQKFSRYRSQRKAAATSPQPAANSPPLPSADDTTTGVSRTRSRYHRRPQDTPSTVNSSSPYITQHHPSSSPPKGQNQDQPRSNAPAHRQSPTDRAGQSLADVAERTLSPRAEEERRRRLDDNGANRRTEASARGRDQDESSSRDKVKGNSSVERYDSPLSTERKQKRLSPQHAQAPREIKAYKVDEDIDTGRGPGCFGFLRRRRTNDIEESEKSNIAHDAKPAGPQFIKQGGGGIVPGIDAPKSAVNAGDRRVTIECKQSHLEFPVDLTTTAWDLINSAANCFSERIDPKTYVLLEHFGKVGVQRPLRRYEHVRDVMNSWDDDFVNTLMAVPIAAAGTDPALLHASTVPHEKPSEVSFLMQYSQKVGKWNKRHITIKEDGQIVARKSPSDREGFNVCHLSDFDIYTPTAKQMSKKIKPPKKICYAIKSQQKTSIFESTANFVHFFCTAEPLVGTAFYSAVQSWRSWYLVNMLGEGQKKEKTQELVANGTTAIANGHAHQPSSGSMESHYQLGTFKPLVDIEQLNDRPSSSHASPQMSLPMRQASKRDKNHPPLSLPKHMQVKDEGPLVNRAGQASGEGAERNSDAFASSGLLGRSYSQRQRDAGVKEAQAAEPFTSGPSLLNSDYRPSTSDGSGLQRNTSRRGRSPLAPTNGNDLHRQVSTRNRGSVDLGRSGSRREPMKPLVDLTPQYREPPQHQKKGRGVKPDQIGPGGLIEIVPSPEEAIPIPPSTDWRGRNANRGLHSSGGGDNSLERTHSGEPGKVRARSNSRPRRPTTSRSRSDSRVQQVPQARFQNTDTYAALTGGAARESERKRQFDCAEEGAFVTGGLLEQASGGWGDSKKGRGVMQGSNARGPMIDVNEGSNYAPGSLLARQERIDGTRGPVIDRQR